MNTRLNPSGCPCYNCRERYYDKSTKTTCHSNCEKYAGFKEEMRQAQRERQGEREYWAYMVENGKRFKRKHR